MSNRPTRRPTKGLPSERVRAAQEANESRSRLIWIFLAVAVVVAGLIAVAFVAGGSDDAEGGGESASGGTVVPSGDLHYGTVEITGAPLPEFEGAPDAAVGMPAPGVAGQGFDGNPVTIGDDSRPKVVMFLAHWCPHCQAEVPRLVEWLEANGMPSDVELYAVVTGTASGRPNFPPGAWLRRESWPVQTIVDDEEQTAAVAYGLSSFPFFVAVGADGEVVTRTSGELTVSQWEALVDAARSGGATSGTVGAESSPAGG